MNLTKTACRNLFLAAALFLGLSPARAWIPGKPLIYEMKIAFETDNWINMYSTATVLSKSDNGVAFQVVANSTTNPTYQLVVTTQGNVGIATNTASPAGIFTIGNGTLTVLSNGNIGIGTTSPGSFLDNGGNQIASFLLDVQPGTSQPGGIIVGSSGRAGAGTTRRQGYFLRRNDNWSSYPSGLWKGSDTAGLEGWEHLVINNSGGDPSIIFMQNLSAAMLIQGNGNVGIGTTSAGYTLQVNGTAYCTSGSWSGSDARWKKNISPLSGSLDKILGLRGVSFDWRADEFPAMKFPAGAQIGFIAQEVKKVVPEVVTTDNNGYLGISYEKLVPVLTEAMKEQQLRIEKLEAENEARRDAIQKLEARLKAVEKKH